MSKKNQHVVPHGFSWTVRGAENERVTKHFDTQSQAIQFSRNIAINQNSEMLIHNKQGKIRERNTYGNDPFPPKG